MNARHFVGDVKIAGVVCAYSPVVQARHWGRVLLGPECSTAPCTLLPRKFFRKVLFPRRWLCLPRWSVLPGTTHARPCSGKSSARSQRLPVTPMKAAIVTMAMVGDPIPGTAARRPRYGLQVLRAAVRDQLIARRSVGAGAASSHQLAQQRLCAGRELVVGIFQDPGTAILRCGGAFRHRDFRARAAYGSG